MAIYLVRHGESEANINPSILKDIPDQRVALTKTGQEQARKVGNLLKNSAVNLKATISSPFERTKETLALITESLATPHTKMPPSVLLSERQLGIVNTLGREYPVHFPKEYSAYKQSVEQQASFFVQPVGGESPFEVCNRILTFMALYDIARNFGGSNDIIIVVHAGVMKAFHHVLTCQSLDAFDDSKEPHNCEVWAYSESFKTNGLKWPAVPFEQISV